jgi:hypothetical protein
MGITGRFEKNGAVYEGEAGRMGYLMTDPAHGIVEAWNPYPDPGNLALGLPGGARIEILGRIGITRLTVFSKENRVMIDGAMPAPDLATVAVLSGFPNGVQVMLNGANVKTVSSKIDDKPVVLVSLDGKPVPDEAALGEVLKAMPIRIKP